MTTELNSLSLLNCRLLEKAVGCSITIEHESEEWHEDIQCNIRFHGSHCLSSMFPIPMARDGRMQMNSVFEDIGEIMALEIQLVSDKEQGLFIKWIEINIPKKSVRQRFDVQRWLHPHRADGRTRLILSPNKLPGYEPKKMLANIHQPKRDYVKYMFFIEISQTKGNINGSVLSINLIGRYGQTSTHPLNVKSGQITPLQTTTHPNIFELTLLDIGLLHECELKLENQANPSAYLISNMYIYCGQYYEIDINQWIENNQTLNRNIRVLETPIPSILLNKIQSKTSFVLWLTGSESIKKEVTVPIKFQFNCQDILTNPIEETVNLRANSITVLAISTACKTPFTSVQLGYNRKSFDYCLAKEIVVLDVLQGQYLYFQSDNEPPKSTDDIDFYSFLPKENAPSSLTKHYIISILTSKKNLSDKHTLKIVLRGERGFTTMLLLHHSSWNDIPFKAKHKDKFLLLASDIGKIKGITMFHASEEAKFNFDILEIFVPDAKTCIRLRDNYKIFNEVIDVNCQEAPIVYIVQIKTGFSTLNDTADIVLTLIGEESSTEWILLTCDSDTKPFQTGQLDTFYIPIKHLGKIRAVDISCSNVDKNCKWFCETIYVHDAILNIKSNYPINRWCGDHQESDLVDTSNPINETTLLETASTKPLTTFLMTVKTGVRTITNLILTPSIHVFFAGQWGSSPVIHLNKLMNRTNLFQTSEIDEFTFTIPDTGMPDVMRVWNTEDLAPWTCEYIDIKHIKDAKTVHFPMGIDLQNTDPSLASYIDLQAETGRVVISLPGPRQDAAYPSYQFILRADQSITSQDSTIHVQLKGDRNQSKISPLIESDNHEPTKAKKTCNFYLYGICSLGELKELSIYFNDHEKNSKSLYNSVVIYDYVMDMYYATKIDRNQIHHKYKLGIVKDTEPRHLNKELDRIEKEFSDKAIQQSDPTYRILYKTQANVLTNLTRNAQILIQLIGEKSTPLFPLEHTRQILSGSFNEYLYRGNESIDRLTKIDLQLIDDENTQWACESIEIQDLKTDEITTFPINDIIESTVKSNKKTTTWKSGVKPGVIYLIRVRTGDQGASLNFRFGSVYVSLKLYGDSGVSNELPLRMPFEQSFYLNSNQTDTFEIGQMISTIGQISSIDVQHNGKKDDSWCIEWINIKDLTTNKSFHFLIGKCLNKDLGTNTKVLHVSADVTTRKSAHDLGSLPNYTIRVKTGTQTPLHTEDTNETSVVSFVLIDPLNDSMRIPLERVNTSARSIFQPSQEDRFDITMTPMSELKVLQIYFNGTFTWYCERITVTDQTSGLSYRFDVERWFREKTDDNNPVHILGQREDDIGWIYSVTVKTQAVLPAQTNLRGKIFLSIYGENSSLNDAILGSGRSMHGVFHAGGEETIELKSNKRLGEIHSIELHLEVAEWQSWLCEMIEVVDAMANWDFLSRTMISKSYKFPINRWLGAHAMDKRNIIRSSLNQEPGYAKMPTYIIHILTGTKNMSNDSEIQSNVYLQFFCSISNHVYGPILLDRSSNNTQPFRKGQTDEFYINDLSYCGEIKKIRLYHDGGKSTSWHCEWIKITNVQLNEIYEFLVEKILDEDLEEGSSNLILYSEKRDEITEGELPTPRTIIS